MKCYIYCTKALPNIGNLNGKVVASWNLNKILRVDYSPLFVTETCLRNDELYSYLNKKEGYAWQVNNLETFDEPLSLDDFGLKRAPQSWCYAYYKGEKVIIISIRPKWVDLILSGKKTLEVRKSYPREINIH